MCLRRAPEKYIAGAALDRAGLDNRLTDGGKYKVIILSSTSECARDESKPQAYLK
jgi:hypothetical protein